MNLLDRLTQRPRRSDVLTFPYDPTAAAAAEQQAIDDILTDTDGTVVDAAKAAVVKVSFHVTGIGREAVDELIEKHPATTEQKRKAREAREDRPKLDADGLRAALLSAMCTKVTFSDSDEALNGLTTAEAADVLSRFSLDDQGEIQSRCLALDRESTLMVSG